MNELHSILNPAVFGDLEGTRTRVRLAVGLVVLQGDAVGSPQVEAAASVGRVA